MIRSIFGWFMFVSVCLVVGGFMVGTPNTETVCFDDDGDVIFYASGYEANNSDEGRPLIHLSGEVYRIKKTGEKLYGRCKSSHGTQPPKGVEYYGGMK